MDIVFNCQGEFSFEKIATGEYEIRAYQPQKASKIEITPEQYSFKVAGEPVQLGKVFNVNFLGVCNERLINFQSREELWILKEVVLAE